MWNFRLVTLWIIAALCFASNVRAQTPESGNVWAVVVGVSQVGVPSRLPSLDFADDDALLFYRLLQDPLGARVARERIFLHLSEVNNTLCAPQRIVVDGVPVTAYPATRGCILANLRKISAQARPGDRVIVFFSGHGVIGYRRGETDETLFLATADWQTSSTGEPRVFEIFPETGLKATEIFDAFADWHVGKTVAPDSPRFLDIWVFFDTCYSGAAATRRQLRLLEGIGTEERLGEEPARGVVRVPREQNTGAPTEADAPKTRFILVLSSGEAQRSWEDTKRKQGVFTYYLARAVRGAAWDASPYRNLSRPDDQLISADLGAYLRLNVNQHTMNLVGEGQLPTALPEFDTIPGFSFTRAERRFGISVDVKTPDNARVTLQLRSPDGRRVLIAEAPYLFTLAQIDAQLGAGDTYLLEIRAPRQRTIQLEIPLSLRAPTSVVVEYPFRGAASISVKIGDEKLNIEPVPNRNLFRAVPTTKQ